MVLFSCDMTGKFTQKLVALILVKVKKELTSENTAWIDFRDDCRRVNGEFGDLIITSAKIIHRIIDNGSCRTDDSKVPRSDIQKLMGVTTSRHLCHKRTKQ